jgi:hypothetical protein
VVGQVPGGGLEDSLDLCSESRYDVPGAAFPLATEHHGSGRSNRGVLTAPVPAARKEGAMTIQQLIEFLQAHGDEGSAIVQVSWRESGSRMDSDIQQITLRFNGDGALCEVFLEAL